MIFVTGLSALTRLKITSGPPQFEPPGTSRAQLSDSFLGGSAPRLRSLKLTGFSFPVLPNLPLSATHLVHLSLLSSPVSGYFSPKTLPNYLTALICLESLCLEHPLPPYDDHHWREDQDSPSLARAVLPFLASFEFRGTGKYLEELATFIDAPQLDKFKINLSMMDPTPELLQFISRTPKLTALDEARMVLHNITSAQITFSSQTFRSSAFIIELERGVSDLAHFCSSSSWFSPLLSIVEIFYIYEDDECHVHTMFDDTASDWVDLNPFTAVKNLYLSGESVRSIAEALGFFGVEIEAAEMLPVLQKIFLDKTKASPDVMQDITRLIDARMAAPRSSHEAPVLEGFMQFRPTIAVSLWDVDWDDNPFDRVKMMTATVTKLRSEDEDEDEDDGD